MRKIFFISSTFALISMGAQELVINTSSGIDYFLEIKPEDTFQGVIETMRSLEINDHSTDLLVSLNVQNNRIEAKTKVVANAPRDYYKPLSSKDKENITYLLTTLGYQSILKISGKRSSLEKIGDQIEPIHPLQFFKFVFSNDELIVAMRNIKGRTWIWKDFIGRILESLNAEMVAGNLTQGQIQDFLSAVKIDPSLVNTPIQGRDWNGFVDNLILHVPRNNDSNRYDM
jgi:hypothetical protein